MLISFSLNDIYEKQSSNIFQPKDNVMSSLHLKQCVSID